MPSLYALFVNKVYQTLVKKAIEREKKYKEQGKTPPQPVRKPPEPFQTVIKKEYKIVKADFNGCEGEVVLPTKPNGRTILYIHGGGFTGGSAKERRSITTYLAEKYGYTVYANDYRLAPEYQYPVLQEDCLNYYKGLLASGTDPQELIIMGESAGGQLVLSLALRLRDEGIPQPKGIGSFSPVVSLADVYPSRTENIPTDYMLAGAMNATDWTRIFGNDNEHYKTPYISPIYGDYSGVAPIFIGVSDAETLLDDARELYKKLTKDHHRVMMDVQHDLVHAYVIFGKMKETRKSVKKMLDFFVF